MSALWDFLQATREKLMNRRGCAQLVVIVKNHDRRLSFLK